MRYLALATDYDGTAARNGVMAAETVAALRHLKETGRKVLMVTGRELDDLKAVCPYLDLFDLIVAENGAILYDPATKAETVLCEKPSEKLVAALKARGVTNVSVGRSIIATWRPHEIAALAAIRDLGLELQIIFNKEAVMILPSSVNKASGLASALERLKLDPAHVAAIGDAENDHAFLKACGLAVAVANALPSLKSEADMVTKGERGEGVIELVDHLLKDDP